MGVLVTGRYKVGRLPEWRPHVRQANPASEASLTLIHRWHTVAPRRSKENRPVCNVFLKTEGLAHLCKLETSPQANIAFCIDPCCQQRKKQTNALPLSQEGPPVWQLKLDMPIAKPHAGFIRCLRQPLSFPEPCNDSYVGFWVFCGTSATVSLSKSYVLGRGGRNQNTAANKKAK